MPNRKPVRQRRPLHHHLKHWLMPHEHNDHRPHLIRAHGLGLMAALLVMVQVAANLLIGPSAQVLGYASNINLADLVAQTNAERVAAGLPALQNDARLNQSASLKAANMFSEDYWAHVSPSGIQPWYWFSQAGYSYSYAGENLAKDFDTTAGAVQGWMNSPGHKANILNTNYTQVGFAVVNGTLVGGQTTLVVAHYGRSGDNSYVPAGGGAPAPAAATPRPATPRPAVVTPAPAPAPTPAPAATPTAVPASSSGTPTPAPKVTPLLAPGITTPSAPEGRSYSLFAPLSLFKTLNWGTLVTIGLLFLLLMVYVITHLTVWRKGLARWRSAHYKLFAAGQVSALAIAITLLGTSGFGTVG